MTTLSDVALLLRTARKQARLTQAELAERAGVARTTVARMENPSKGDMSVSALVRLLEAAGCDLKDFVPFPDHAQLSDRDLAFLSERANLFGAGLVTTEKDWVRLSPEWRMRITAWPVRARFEHEAGLENFLVNTLGFTHP